LPFGENSSLGLARAYALQGDAPKARAVYKDFPQSGKTPTPMSLL